MHDCERIARTTEELQTQPDNQVRQRVDMQDSNVYCTSSVEEPRRLRKELAVAEEIGVV